MRRLSADVLVGRARLCAIAGVVLLASLALIAGAAGAAQAFTISGKVTSERTKVLVASKSS
jgi:hypothetical protein